MVHQTAKIDMPALQRARGEIDLAVVAGRLDRFYQSGSSKIFMPKTYATTLEAVLVNTAGGLTEGDEFDVQMTADGNTHLTVSTQTAERVYRALGSDTAKMRIKITLTGPASLHWLPQETIMFDGAGFSRHLHVKMDEGASFLASEMMVFGRTAMHEEVRHGRLFDRWRIHRGDKLIHAEALRLEGDIAGKLDHLASASGCVSFATTLFIGRDSEEKANAAREFFKSYNDIKTAVSAWDGKLVIRSVGGDTARLKKVIATFMIHLRQIENPRVWNA